MFKDITPKFINKIDAFLLVNHPILWMSKIHYVLWHGITLWFFSALLGILLPIDLTHRIEFEIWYFLLTVLAVIILCFWIYRYVIFNKNKNYGFTKFSDEYKNFILVFFSVTIFLLVPWPFEMIYNQRIANMYSDEEVLQDIDKLNECDPYMIHSTNNYYSWYDSTTHVQYINIRKLNPYGSSYYTPYFMKSDSALYPQLQTEFQLSNKYKAVNAPSFLREKIEKYISIAKKYNIEITSNPDEIIKKYTECLAKEKIAVSDLYSYGPYQYELQSTFDNLCESKFKTLFIFTSDYLWVIFYFVIVISSFLLLFKITYWQQYLIMIVILFLYPLIVFIFSQLLPHNGLIKGTNFYEAGLIALIIFSGITIGITSRENREYKPFYNIFNQLFYVSLIFTPMLITVFLHDATNLFHNYDYLNYYSHENMKYPGNNQSTVSYVTILDGYYWQYWHNEYKQWINITKYFGIITFIGCLPFFNNLFVKQISLPEKS